MTTTETPLPLVTPVQTQEIDPTNGRWIIQHSCCALKQIVVDTSFVNVEAYIIERMNAFHIQHGYTTFMIILKTGLEDSLIPIVKKLGFVPMVQFHRRSRYEQNVQLVFYILEPTFENGAVVENGKNNIQFF